MPLIAKSNSTGLNGPKIHNDLSSTIGIALTPTGGILRKEKTGRSFEATLREFRALALVNQALQEYKRRNPEYNISSPTPIQLNRPNDRSQNAVIDMSFEPGICGESLLANDFESTNGRQRNTLHSSFYENLGRLFAIKEHEHWVHSDFQLRHVLFEEGSQTADQLTLIDVENLYAPQSPEYSDSHIEFFDNIFRCLRKNEIERLQTAPRVEDRTLAKERLELIEQLDANPVNHRSLLQEHVDFLDQLFRSNPVINLKTPLDEKQGTRTHKVVPYSIYGTYQGRIKPREQVTNSMLDNLSTSKRTQHTVFSLLAAFYKGFNSVDMNELPLSPRLVEQEQADLTKPNKNR